MTSRDIISLRFGLESTWQCSQAWKERTTTTAAAAAAATTTTAAERAVRYEHPEGHSRNEVGGTTMMRRTNKKSKW